jgi:hypothetical protein
VTAEDDIRLQRPQLPSRRVHPQEWMDSEPLVPRTEVPRGAERIAAHEHTPVGPPEGHLFPGITVLDRDESERAERALGNEVVTDAEPSCERGAVAIVAVQQLEHSCGCARCADSLLDIVSIDGVDHPDATVQGESVRAALHELVRNPAEADVELVTEPDSHPGESTGTR